MEKKEKKFYRECPTAFIGSSDISSLVVVGIREMKGVISSILSFGIDTCYHAYIVEGEDVEIGEHYHQVGEFHHWIKIYDDDSLVYTCRADRILIWRAGDAGCVIQKIMDKQPEHKED